MVESFDVLTATASELQKLMDDGELTSEELVNTYLKQINKHNHYGMRLNAVISTAGKEEIAEAARALDHERRVSGKRGPLHGIPILVKDNICTPSIGLPTTCGSFALVGAKARDDAVLVKRLIAAGALVIGKANLTEWASFKESFMTSGWSAVGGQTQSPYVRGGVAQNATALGHSTPAGSSSGCAVGVAAGFAPIAIATESDGSIISPAGRGGVYALKLTVGSVPTDGCQANSAWIACNGAMAKSALDVSDTLSALMGRDDLSSNLDGRWNGLSVGFVDFSVWKPLPVWVEDSQEFFADLDTLLESAIEKIANDGATVVRDVELIRLPDLTKNTPYSDFTAISAYQTREGFAKFMAGFDGSSVQTLEDLIQFNQDFAVVELPAGKSTPAKARILILAPAYAPNGLEHPGQQNIIKAAENKLTAEDFEKYSAQVRKTAVEAVQSVLEKHHIDAIIGSSDARLAGVAAAAGFPIGNIPLGFSGLNGRAVGLSILAPAGMEQTILKVMSAWNRSFPQASVPPPMLVNWEDSVNNKAHKL